MFLARSLRFSFTSLISVVNGFLSRVAVQTRSLINMNHKNLKSGNKQAHISSSCIFSLREISAIPSVADLGER